MKKIILIIPIILLLFTAKSFSQIDMSIYGGLSTPNDKLGEVYHENDNAWDLVSKGIDMGWHLGARVRLPMDTGFFFYAGMAWNRFPDAQLEVKKPDNDTTYQIEAQQDIIPIGVGVQYYITKKVVVLYVNGQLNYNYFTTHGRFLDLPAPNFNLSDASSRGGFQVGIGIMVNFVLVEPFLEFSYSMPNLIGKASGEPTKQYFNLSIGINL